MKILRTIIVVCFLSLSLNSFGQSKGDTIEWLKEAFDAHFNKLKEINEVEKQGDDSESCGFICKLVSEANFGTIYFVNLLSVNECEIKIWKREELYTIPVRGLRVVRDEKFQDKYRFVQSGKIIKTEMESEGKRIVKFVESTALMIDNTITPELPGRIAKALEHLGTFCTKKEDLF